MVSVSPRLKTEREGSGVDSERMRGFAPCGPSQVGQALGSQAQSFPRASRPDRSNADLAMMIESEIIPRLMLAHRPAPRTVETPAVVESSVGPRTMEAFVRMTISNDAETLIAFVEALLRGGLALEEIYVDLLIPTARRLGDDWNADTVSFTDVTIGLSRLQQVVRTLGWKYPPHDTGEDGRSAYFIPCPDEQHTFGLFLVEDCFRRSGWRTWLDTAATRDEAARTVGRDWFDLFGLSVNSDTSRDWIASTITTVRKASCNPDLFVMVGGRVFVDNPTLAAEIGADATALTERDALLIADKAIRPVAIG